MRNENDRPLLEFELEKVVRGFFAPELLLDYLRYFVLFEQGDDGIIKKIAGYHQFHAVREAVRATVIAATQAARADKAAEERATYGKRVVPGSRKGGIVWHTQGSGKSISMVCFAGKLMQQPEMQNPTMVVVTDRNDLDGQLFQTFMRCARAAEGNAAAGRGPRAAARRCWRAAIRRHHLHDGAEVLARRATKSSSRR